MFFSLFVNHVNKSSLVVIMLLIFSGLLGAQESQSPRTMLIETSGLPQEGILFLRLVEEADFYHVETFVKEARLDLSLEAKAEIVWNLGNLPVQPYALRAFVDCNGNGVLDRGLFGPTEPWALSWNSGHQSFPPQFASLSFVLESHTTVRLDF